MFFMIIDSITKYQDEACATFKEHRALSPEEAMLLDWALGLPGEVGEVCELIKHHIFHGEELDMMKLAKELGDVQWYISAIAKTTAVPMDGILSLNIGKLSHRYSGKGYDKKASANRHKAEEKYEETDGYQELRDYIEQNGDKELKSKEEEYQEYLRQARQFHYEQSNNVLFIGNECTGKTTLSELLTEYTGMKRYKGTYMEDNKFDRASEMIYSCNACIFDRLYFPDELVYSELKGYPQPEWAMKRWWDLAKIMAERNFVVFYVRADIDELGRRMSERGDVYVDVSELPAIEEYYTSEILPKLVEAGVAVHVIDTGIMSAPETFARILQILRRHKHPLVREEE